MIDDDAYMSESVRHLLLNETLPKTPNRRIDL